MGSGVMPTPILTYFDIPGRGEISRLCFTLGNVDFEEKLVPFSEWPALKPTTPFGQIPILQIGDTVVAQSAGIDHYAAKAGGFIPEDPVQELLSDQAYYYVTIDVHAAILSPTMRMPKDEAVEKRKELAAGPLKDKLDMLDKLVANRPGRFIAGDKLSLGDLAIFNFLGMIKSQFWDGIPAGYLDGFAALQSYRNEVAREPRVKAFYDSATLELRVKGYRPDQEDA
jgi:glutathione S-transferase